MAKKLLFLVIFLISCRSIPQDHSQILVSEVIDGDTVRLANGRLLRYIGIDTPETNLKKGGKFIYQPQPFAEEAKEYNRKLVEGKTVKIEFDLEKEDKYGRLLGYCFVDDIFVNAKLIEQGYAVLYTYPPNVKYADRFFDLQKQARDKKAGLWGSYQVIAPEAAGNLIGQIRTVQGKVLSTYQSAKCVFLNFGQDYKTDFTVVIFNNSLGAFRQQGIDPVSFYRDKTVSVSGRIREYNGPEIIVNTPYEIEIIQ
ncbi:MAG: thermonuclease family protein [Candidatus Omnitrophica bacterium]|nr:thermonuclease family protein [Candidatus Omnitrophota bacterium]MBU2044515.1 thermonuclease family protein [Candidatus Omnitrophota bacterium]MBU2473406.1 thermonuclease family protein [Candidatus Omnitrophota bacterium]